MTQQEPCSFDRVWYHRGMSEMTHDTDNITQFCIMLSASCIIKKWYALNNPFSNKRPPKK